ncbi:DUF4384 domain-containing protein [Dyadobacter sp. 676]|uniref:DUF4384 domain-containing protein n=1 Tax=Dyadobacter sp. 676 TaxID=3088362 RepID=A0AAU8FK33_9BACT
MRSSIKIAAFAVLTWTLAGPVAPSQAQTRGMGLKMDDSKYLRLPRKSPDVLLKGPLPGSFSIRGLLPEIGDQGMDGTCVGWSAAYYMRTAMEARKTGLGNQPEKITAKAFSPGWLYGQLKSGLGTECTEGVYLEDALEVMKTKGAALLSCAPGSCDVRYGQCDDQAANYTIADYATLFNPNDNNTTPEQRIAAIKSALVESGNAVLIGMLVPPSFIEAVGEHWQPAAGETIENAAGGHSMAVIGYDDHVRNGSFLIANSWGKSWGAGGYIWASYADIARFTRYAYQVYTEPAVKPTPQTVSLKGNVDFVTGNGAMPVRSTLLKGAQVTPAHAGSGTGMISYTMSRPYASGTRFKMVINNTRQAYVYILGSDMDNRVSPLFPYNSGDITTSAVVPANSQVLMPSAHTSFTLDDVKGEDYFIIFISRNQLNLTELAAKIKNAEGTIVQKVYTALGEDFISPHAIVYEPGKISYEVKGAPKGSVVPMLVRIIHQ